MDFSTVPPRSPFLEEAYLRPYVDIIAPLRGEVPFEVLVHGGRADLLRRRFGVFRSVELPGGTFADYADLQYGNMESGKMLLESIIDRPDVDVVVLRNLAVDSPTTRLAEELSVTNGWSVFKQSLEEAPFADLEGTWEEFYTRQRDRKSRYNLRRSARLLDSMGSVDIVHYSTPEEIDQNLDDAFRLYSNRQRGLRSIWSFNGEIGQTFYRAVAIAFAQRGMMDLTFLKVDGVPVAFVYGLRHEGIYYYYKVGVTSSIDILRFSPGSILLEHLLEQAFTDGLKRFDFMLGSEPYKYIWASDSKSVCTLVLAKRGFRSAMAWRLYATRTRLRDLLRRSPVIRSLAARVIR